MRPVKSAKKNKRSEKHAFEDVFLKAMARHCAPGGDWRWDFGRDTGTLKFWPSQTYPSVSSATAGICWLSWLPWPCWHLHKWTNDNWGLSTFTSCSIYGCSPSTPRTVFFSVLFSHAVVWGCIWGAVVRSVACRGKRGMMYMTGIHRWEHVVIVWVAVLRLCEKRTCFLGNLKPTIRAVQQHTAGASYEQNPSCGIRKWHVM